MFEFAFVRERKAVTLLDNAASGVLRFVTGLSQTERACALAWANAALLAGVGPYGRSFAYTPMKMDREKAVKAVLDFAAYRAQIEQAADKVQGRPAHDPAVSAYKWEMMATLVVMVTAGACFHEGARNAARAAWKMLGASRPFAKDAVRVMTIYAKAYDVECIPKVPNKKSDKSFVLALASNLPPMFRSK